MRNVDVYFIESNEITSLAIRAIIESSPFLRCVGHGLNVASAADELNGLAPDVVLVKISAGCSDVEGSIETIRAACPTAAIVIKLVEDDAQVIRDAFQAGAVGLVMRGATAKSLEMALRATGSGGCWIDGDVWKRLLAPTLAAPVPLQPTRRIQTPDAHELTLREQQVLALVSQGFANREIAAQLGIGAETVKTHVRKLMGKLGARTRTEAAVYAARTESVS